MLHEIALRVLSKCATSHFQFFEPNCFRAAWRQQKSTVFTAGMYEDRRSGFFIGTCFGREGTCAFASNNASSVNAIGQIERKCSIVARAGDRRAYQYKGGAHGGSTHSS